MAGGSTRDGAQSATGGIIFKDMVFWVAIRVPMRSHILELIRQNGGVVAPLEKDAQVLIADHARTDAPPGSVSWKYITDSVANGFAQLTDRYCILRPSGRGASGRTKMTRSGFTDAEDAALANWVLSHPKDHYGNQLYKEFAESHPSHPWQSWRDRFVKVLVNRPIQGLKKLAMSAADLAVQPSLRPKGDSRPTTPGTTPRKTKKRPPAASTASQTTPTAVQRRSPRRKSTIWHPAGSAKETWRQPSLAPVSSPAQSEEVEVETQVNMRDRFYHDLLVFVEESRVPVNPQPEVRGKRLELWDLSQAVDSQKVPLEEVDWLKVAEDLQYDWRQDQGVADDLRSCFHENLANFFEALSSFSFDDDEGEDEDEEQEMEEQVLKEEELEERELEEHKVEEEVLEEEVEEGDEEEGDEEEEEGDEEDEEDEEEEEEDKEGHEEKKKEEEEAVASQYGPGPPRSAIRSSPPQGSLGRKRGLDDHPLALVENTAKRRRHNRIAEIPSTPEEKLGISDTRSPTVSKTLQQQQTHGVRGLVTPAGKILLPVNEDDDEISDEVLPEMHANSAPLLETRQSSFDLTPSQQLHSEALNVDPIPLNLGQCRSNGRQQQSDTAEPQQESAAKPKTKSRFARRSLPVSFKSNNQPSFAQEAETRAQQPSAPIRVEPGEEGQSQSIRECVEYYESLGYSRAIVIESLNRASMRPGWPASHLMELLTKKQKMPSNIEGVWTDRDDKGLRYADSVHAKWTTASAREQNKAKKELARLIHKHTEEDVELRRRFFAAQARMG